MPSKVPSLIEKTTYLIKLKHCASKAFKPGYPEGKYLIYMKISSNNFPFSLYLCPYKLINKYKKINSSYSERKKKVYIRDKLPFIKMEQHNDYKIMHFVEPLPIRCMFIIFCIYNREKSLNTENKTIYLTISREYLDV